MNLEFTRAFIVEAEFKELTASPIPYNLLAEVVLIDKANQSHHPTLYQLKKDVAMERDAFAIKHGIIIIHREAFVKIGEVSSIDKKQRTILLCNQNVVSYDYLIIASGIQENDEKEFSAGLIALIDALRIHKYIPSISIFSNLLISPPYHPVAISLCHSNIPPHTFQSITLQNIPKNSSISETHKCLYELQL